ncbi:MAG: toxin-antitoxin system protein [Candidatus Omnitrophica bacterium]|nr:toxin-antitoxin system protein [Candidatus Omnitrophota bacterium]
MGSTTVRINPTSHIILRRIAKQSGESMQSALTKAVELYRRKNFLQMANEAFASMRKNPKAWQEELKEREDWDMTLLDDINS